MSRHYDSPEPMTVTFGCWKPSVAHEAEDSRGSFTALRIDWWLSCCRWTQAAHGTKPDHPGETSPAALAKFGNTETWAPPPLQTTPLSFLSRRQEKRYPRGTWQVNRWHGWHDLPFWGLRKEAQEILPEREGEVGWAAFPNGRQGPWDLLCHWPTMQPWVTAFLFVQTEGQTRYYSRSWKPWHAPNYATVSPTNSQQRVAPTHAPCKWNTEMAAYIGLPERRPPAAKTPVLLEGKLLHSRTRKPSVLSCCLLKHAFLCS